MMLFEWRMVEKFGKGWLDTHKIFPLVKLEELVSIGTEQRSAVLMWHFWPDDRLKAVLEKSEKYEKNVWVLFVGQGPPPKSWLNDIANWQSRACLLKYGVPGIDPEREEAWEQQRPWIRRRFEEFVAAVDSQVSGPPPWHLLDPPSAPEHVIACYLCAIAGGDPQSSWAEGFEEEVGYWATKRTEHTMVPRLDWDTDNADSDKLRAFLRAVGVLESSAER